jgi:hypothetical protein
MLDVKSLAPRGNYLVLTGRTAGHLVGRCAAHHFRDDVHELGGTQLTARLQRAVESDVLVVVATRSQPDTDPAHH